MVHHRAVLEDIAVVGARLKRGVRPSLRVDRVPGILVLAVGLPVVLAGCSRPSSPLAPLAGQSVRAITIADHNGHSAVLKEPRDIQFVTLQLAALPTRREGKVTPEFELEFTAARGPALHLRLDSRCIGPAVPASDVVPRWYFQDRTLYEFIKARIALVAAKPSGPA